MLRALLVLATCLGIPAFSFAQESAGDDGYRDFDALVAEAVAHYSARRYQEALELFERAHAMRPEPELVYNIARSHERLVHREEAISWYEQFLELPGTTGELRSRALSNLNALRQEIAALEASRATIEQGHEPNAQAQDQSDQNAQPTVAEPDSGVAPSRIGPLGIAGWVLVGVGGVSAVTGGIFGALALDSQTSFNSLDHEAQRVDLREEVAQRALVADVLLWSGVGLVAIGTALAVIDIVRRRRERQRSGVTLAPLLAGRGVGLFVVGRLPLQETTR